MTHKNDACTSIVHLNDLSLDKCGYSFQHFILWTFILIKSSDLLLKAAKTPVGRDTMLAIRPLPLPLFLYYLIGHLALDN